MIIQGQTVKNIISNITKSCGIGNGTINILATEDARFWTSTDSSYMSISADIKVKNKFKVNVNMKTLATVCSGRKDLCFEQVEGLLKVSSGCYKAELTTYQYQEDQMLSKIDKLNTEKNINIKDKEIFFNAMRYASLQSNFFTDELAIIGKSDGKVLTLTCADTRHIAVVRTPFNTKLNISIPVSYVDKSNIHGDNIKFFIDDNNYYIWSNTTKLVLPMINTSSESFDETINVINKFSKASTTIKVNLKKILEVLNNLGAVITNSEDEGLQLLPKEDGFMLSCGSKLGSVSDFVDAVVKKTDKKPIKLDSPILKELLSKANDQSTINIYNDQVIIISFKTQDDIDVTYLLAALS